MSVCWRQVGANAYYPITASMEPSILIAMDYACILLLYVSRLMTLMHFVYKKDIH